VNSSFHVINESTPIVQNAGKFRQEMVSDLVEFLVVTIFDQFAINAQFSHQFDGLGT
jgi:hypothetical protein